MILLSNIYEVTCSGTSANTSLARAALIGINDEHLRALRLGRVWEVQNIVFIYPMPLLEADYLIGIIYTGQIEQYLV